MIFTETPNKGWSCGMMKGIGTVLTVVERNEWSDLVGLLCATYFQPQPYTMLSTQVFCPVAAVTLNQYYSTFIGYYREWLRGRDYLVKSSRSLWCMHYKWNSFPYSLHNGNTPTSLTHNLLWSAQWKSCMCIVKWCCLYLYHAAIALEITVWAYVLNGMRTRLLNKTVILFVA